MLVQEEFVSINTDPATVERYLTDPALLDAWRSPAITIDPLEGKLMDLGSMYKLRVKGLGLEGATYSVTERGKGQITLTIDGLWRGTEIWRWWADGPRTVVQNRVEYVVPNEVLRPFVVGIGNLLGSLDMRLQLAQLRNIIEKSATAAPQQIKAKA